MNNFNEFILKYIYIIFCYIIRPILFFPHMHLFYRDRKRNYQKIFLDITEVYFHDYGTGIQRVVNKLRKHIKQKNCGFEVCEVYIKPCCGYFSCDTKKPIKIRKGDILLGIDPIFVHINSNGWYLKKIYKAGVHIWFFVYDLIPIINKDTVQNVHKKYFEKWLHQILQYTGIIAISNSTLQDVKNYIKSHSNLVYNKDLRFEYALLGSDFKRRDDIRASLDENKEISFLMVSTVEPRKKYDQAVEAFSILWNKGYDCTLQIVGRPGWNNEETISMIQNHNLLNKKLFWYNTGISDDELAVLYQNCTAVLFTSIAEGFGLAIMEAASYKKPLVLRDLPVFKEIAADNAFYFSGLSPQGLADKIEEWIKLYKENKHPVSDNIKFISWDDCTSKVLSIITE